MSFDFVPKKIFFTNGTGSHKEPLEAFHFALKDAGIEKYNIVNVSSIIPPFCEVIDTERGLQELKTGQILFCVMARETSNQKDKIIGASISCAFLKNQNVLGYIAEHHSTECTSEKSLSEYTEKLATSLLSLKIETLNHHQINVITTTQVAKVQEDRLHTDVIAAAVFLF